MRSSIYSLTRQQLEEWLVEHGQKKFRAQQVWDWLYKKRVDNFEAMRTMVIPSQKEIMGLGK